MIIGAGSLRTLVVISTRNPEQISLELITKRIAGDLQFRVSLSPSSRDSSILAMLVKAQLVAAHFGSHALLHERP